jgi:hypothetical protein
MQKENWQAIEKAHAVQLDDTEGRLLDNIQNQLRLNDREFLHFLVLVGKIAPSAARLGSVYLPKP